MGVPHDKPTLLRRMNETREQLIVFLAKFDADQMIEVHPPDGWSIKDAMAHITFWEKYALERYQEVARGEKPQLFGDITQDDVDRINQQALEAGRALSLKEVQTAFDRVYQELWAVVQTIPENPDDAWWGLWPTPELPWQLIAYNTFEHYPEHMESIRRWVRA